MDIPNIRFLNPGFYTYFGQATFRKWIERGMILKVGDEYTSEVDTYYSYGPQRAMNQSEDQKPFYSCTSMTHAIKANLQSLLCFSSVMATFEMFPQQKLGVEKYVYIQSRSQHDHFKSRRCCKLNFGLLQGKVKSHHFFERIEAKRQYFTFSTNFLEYLAGNNIGQPF